MSHCEELLNQLKMIQLEWFRSAADLDQKIRGIESLLEETNGKDYATLCVGSEMRWRADLAKMHGWDEIFKLENVVWQQLFEAMKTKEES